MNTMASQITGVLIVYSTICSGSDQREHRSCASLAFVKRIHRGPVSSPHKGPVMQKIIPFDDIVMIQPDSRPVCQQWLGAEALKWSCPSQWWLLFPHLHQSQLASWCYTNVTWVPWHLKSQANTHFVQQIVRANTKENIKVPHYWSFVRGIHRWPFTNMD